MTHEYLSTLANHLWQSTLFAGAMGLLALTLRRNHAAVRCWLWTAASLKFLVPFVLLVGAGSHIQWRPASPVSHTAVVSVMKDIAVPFAPATPIMTQTAESVVQTSRVTIVLFAVWFCGSALVASAWFREWRRMRQTIKAASPLRMKIPIPAFSTPARVEPGVVGIFRPVLLLPEGITDRLTERQLDAIFVHELCHVRRHDNLAAAIHMAVETLFWFHPMVWWIERRLIEEREHACDEEVLRAGGDPQTYAEGILNVCKFYKESSLVCMSGVTGSSLRKRIEAIMTNRIGPRLNFGKRLLVSAVGIVALAVPIIIGALSAPPSHAQSQDSPRLQFEAASIKLNVSGQNGVTFSASPGGRLTVVNNPLFNVIDNAYGVRERFLLLGGPDWIDSDRYDIEAKAEGEPGKDQIMKMLQTLLAERFKLTVHREMRELPVYTLTVGKSGPKLTQFKEGSCVDYDPNNPPPAASAGKPHCGNNLIRGGRWEASKTDMPGVTGALSVLVRRKVIDKTGLTGLFDVHIELPPDPLGTTDSSSPSIFTIVQEQLGLKLESDKDLVEVLVIDHVERPSEN